MLFSFLVTLREGFEIALIVAIVLGYLARTGNRRHFRPVWAGVGGAALVTFTIGAVLRVTASELSGQAQEAFEGGTMLLAVVVLTWMVFWMRRQAASLGGELRAHLDVALERGSVLALAGLAFSAVAREGIETALFLFAGSTAARGESGALFWLGGLAGFVIAGALGYLVYRGAHRLPIRQFFGVTGIVVLVMAAGLASNGLGALRASGLVGTLGGGRPWDTDAVLSLTSTGGQFLHTLIGYDSAPTWGQLIVFWTYLLVGVGAFLRGTRSPRRPAIARAQVPDTTQ